MPPVKNYTLGKLGVNVDKSPLHIDPGELLQAQNAIRNKLGVDGGLCNRPGLTKINASTAAGSILGGIAMPGARLFDSGGITLYLGQASGVGVQSWYTSSDLFATTTLVTTIASWQLPSNVSAVGQNVSHMGAFFNGQLYYASSDYTVGATSPSIRVFNGTDDRQLCTILPVTCKGVMSIVADKATLFILTLDSGADDTDWSGRVFRVDGDGRLTQIGDALPSGYIPTALVVYNNQLFVGGSRVTTSNEAKIFRLQPLDETTWSTDDTLTADDYIITSLKVFRGLLFATTKNGGAATKGKIRSRTVAGVWSTVDSTSNNTGSYESLEEFNSYLYASSRNYSTTTNTAVIRRSADGSTWATVYNSSSSAGVGQLSVIGQRLFSVFEASSLLYSSSGTSYTAGTVPGDTGYSGIIGAPLIRVPTRSVSEISGLFITS